MQAGIQEFHCTVYQDYKISIPVKIRKLLELHPQDEIILKVDDNNQIVLDTVQRELRMIQQNIKSFFGNKSISKDFLKNKGLDYDDN